MVVKSIPKDEDSHDHLSEVTIYVPYKGQTIMTRILIRPDKTPILNRAELTAILTGACSEAVNQCINGARIADERKVNNATVPASTPSDTE